MIPALASMSTHGLHLSDECGGFAGAKIRFFSAYLDFEITFSGEKALFARKIARNRSQFSKFSEQVIYKKINILQ